MKYFIINNIKETYIDNELIIVNTLNNACIKLKDDIFIEQYNILKKQGTNNIDSELKKLLYEQEILVNIKLIEKYNNQLLSIMRKVLYITIMPTEQCNFRCTYCYEDFNTKIMNENKIEIIKEFVSDLVEKHGIKRVSLFWFGGEPTLCKDIVLKTTAYFRDMSNKYNIKFISGMTTNGYLLNTVSFKQYLEAGITCYQITIDGLHHDDTRMLVNGSPTFNKIIDNIKRIHLLDCNKYKFNITIRNNILATNKDFHWYMYLKEIIGNDERFSVFLKRVLKMGGANDENLDIIKSDHDDIFIEHLNAAKSSGLKIVNNKNTPLCETCYASYPYSFIFRANGDINKCSVALYDEINRIGYIDEISKTVKIFKEKNELWTNIKLTDDCLVCPNVTICMNKMCPKYMLFNNKVKNCI